MQFSALSLSSSAEVKLQIQKYYRQKYFPIVIEMSFLLFVVTSSRLVKDISSFHLPGRNICESGDTTTFCILPVEPKIFAAETQQHIAVSNLLPKYLQWPLGIYKFVRFAKSKNLVDKMKYHNDFANLALFNILQNNTPKFKISSKRKFLKKQMKASLPHSTTKHPLDEAVGTIKLFYFFFIFVMLMFV